MVTNFESALSLTFYYFYVSPKEFALVETSKISASISNFKKEFKGERLYDILLKEVFLDVNQKNATDNLTILLFIY